MPIVQVLRRWHRAGFRLKAAIVGFGLARDRVDRDTDPYSFRLGYKVHHGLVTCPEATTRPDPDSHVPGHSHSQTLPRNEETNARERSCVCLLARAIPRTPFAPFLVLLCHILDTSNLSHLRRLEEFAALSDSSRMSLPFSGPMGKLRSIVQGHVQHSMHATAVREASMGTLD